MDSLPDSACGEVASLRDSAGAGTCVGILSRLTFEKFTATLFLTAVALAACLMPAQNDTWWHLRAGKEILDTGSIRLRDSFSHTVYGGYWPDHEWLSQAIFYGVYRVGGLPLLTALAAAIVALSWAIVWRLIPGSTRIRLLLAAAGVVTFAREWALRPQIFTLLFLALTAWLLVRRRYAFLPPLFAVWANLHGGVMLGMMVLSGAALAAAVAERRLLTRPAIAAAVCALATGITPLGFSLWTEVPAALKRSREYGIVEWNPPRITDPAFAPFWLLSAALIVLVIATRPWRRKAAAPDVLLWVALALLPVALSATRNVPALLVFLVPAVGLLLHSAWSISDPVRRERPALNAALLAVATLGGVAGIAYCWTTGIARLQWRPLPQPAITAIASCPEQMYNRYDEGGYLIWFTPSRRVFIDSRQDPYPPELMQEHIRIERSGDYEETFRRYSIRCAFLPTESLLTERLTNAHWAPLYKDPTWIVLAHP
jgi:hypothetical protein